MAIIPRAASVGAAAVARLAAQQQMASRAPAPVPARGAAMQQVVSAPPVAVRPPVAAPPVTRGRPAVAAPQTPVETILKAVMAPVDRADFRPDYSQYNLTGYMGTPGQSFTQRPQAPFPDPSWASNVQTMVQQARPGSIIEPTSEGVLRYQAQQVINDVYPDMAGRPLGNDQMRAVLDLARAQDYQNRPPGPPLESAPAPRRPETLEAPELPSIYTLGPLDRKQSVPDTYMGPMTNAHLAKTTTTQPPTTVNQELLQQAMNLDAEIASIQNYMQSADYFQNPNPYYQSVLTAKQGERDQLRAQIEAEQATLPDSPNIGGSIANTIGNFGPEDVWGPQATGLTQNQLTELILDRAGDAIRKIAEQEVPGTDGTTVGEGFQTIMQGMNTPFEWSVDKLGELMMAASYSPEIVRGLPGGEQFNEFIDDSGIRDAMLDAYINGYGDFGPGGRSVWEMLVGKTDNYPWYVKYPIRIATDLVVDPLTWVPIAGWGGKLGKTAGLTLRNLPDATRGERVLGAALRGGGAAVEEGAVILDTMGFVLPVRAGRWFGKRTGVGRGSLFAESIATVQNEANRTLRGATHNLDSAGRRNPIPEEPGGGASAAPEHSVADIAEDVPGGSLANDAPEPNVTPHEARPEPRSIDGEERLVDVETGQVMPPASAVPDSMPELRSAIAGSTTRGTVRRSGESALSPRAGGARPQDVALDIGIQAIESGDTVTAQQMNDLLAELRTYVESGIGNDPLFLNRGEGGQLFNYPDRPTRTSSGYPMSPEQVSILSNTPPTTAYGMRNALLKQAYADALEEMHTAMGTRQLWSKYLPASDLPVRADEVFRLADDASWVDERIGWLIREFVRTPDADRAARIYDVLNSVRPDGNWYGLDNAGKPYLKAVPDDLPSPSGGSGSLRGEINSLIETARREYQEALGNAPRANQADQIAGGLSKQSQNAGEAIRRAEIEEARIKSEVAAKRAAERAPDANAAQPNVRKAGSKKWEALDDQGNVIGTNPTKKDAVTRWRRWYEAQGQSGIVHPATARVETFKERWRQAEEALTRPADLSAGPTLRHADLAYQNQMGELSDADALYLDQTIEWTPPGWPNEFGRQPREWSVLDAIRWAEDQKVIDPKFNYEAEFQRIAELAAKFDYDSFSAFARGVDKLGDTRLIKRYDAFMNGVIRQHRRYGPLTALRNIIGDEIGTQWQLIVTGEAASAWDLMPHNLYADTKVYRKPSHRVDGTVVVRDPHHIAESLDDPFVRGTGQLVPYKLMPGVSRGEDAFGGLPAANKRLQSLGPLRHAGNLWAVPYAKDFLNTIDITSRLSVWKRNYQRIVREQGMRSFAKTLNDISGDRMVTQQWIEAIEEEARRKAGGVYHGSFSPGDVRRALDGKTNRNVDLARAWQRQLNLASDAATKRVDDVLFSYKNTNADEIARRIFVFHYWQTRAYPLHVRAALRNPVLINGYYKMWAQLQQLSEEEQHSPYLDGMFRFFQGPDGIESFFNGFGILLPTTIMDMESEKGQRWQVLINQMSPFIIAATAVMGGDATPDLTATRGDENFIRRFANFMIGQGVDISQIPVLGDSIDPNTMKLTIPTEVFTQRLIDAANAMLQKAGIPVGDYTPFIRGTNELEQIRTWVGYHATEQFGPMFDDAGNLLWTSEQMALYEAALIGIQSGLTGNPLLDAAHESYGNEEGLTAAFAFLLPGGAVTNSSFRNSMKRLSGEYIEQGFQGNSSQRTMYELNNDTRAGDPAWTIASRQYYAIGSQESQEAYAIYNRMIYDAESLSGRSIMVLRNGQLVEQPLGFLTNMSEEERRRWADQWLQEQGFAEGVQQMLEERKAFSQANPEFGSYLEFRTSVFRQEEQPGGVRAWRESMAETNPNFKKQMEIRRSQLEAEGRSAAIIEEELDAWASSQAAYHAMIGEPWKVTDQPGAVYDPSRDFTANPAYGALAGTSGGSSTGGSGGTWTDDDGPEKYTPEWFQQNAQEQTANFSFENMAAETLYGDNWDLSAVAQSGNAKHGYTGSDKGFRTEYYPGGSINPGADILEKRYQEWKRVMLATNPYADTSYEAWLAWEAGIWSRITTDPAQVPEQWQPYLT